MISKSARLIRLWSCDSAICEMLTRWCHQTSLGQSATSFSDVPSSKHRGFSSFPMGVLWFSHKTLHFDVDFPAMIDDTRG